MKSGLAATLSAVFFVGVVASGSAVSHVAENSKENDVRAELYSACANSGFYVAPNSGAQKPLQCNRESIDLFLSNVYGDSYLPPPPDKAAVDEYEAELLKYKKE